jgi:hypothetical protein
LTSLCRHVATSQRDDEHFMQLFSTGSNVAHFFVNILTLKVKAVLIPEVAIFKQNNLQIEFRNNICHFFPTTIGTIKNFVIVTLIPGLLK